MLILPCKRAECYLKREVSHAVKITFIAPQFKTKRGLIKPRGENQIQYLHNILTHDISFGIGPAGTGKTFLAVAAAVVEALERQEFVAFADSSCGGSRRKIRFLAGRFRAEN